MTEVHGEALAIGGLVLGTGVAAATTTEAFHSYGWSTVDSTQPAEISAAGCGKDRATQLWITDPADAPAWENQPAQRTRLPVSAGDDCPAAHLEWDALDAIKDAVAAGQSYLTLVLTMPDTELADPAFSRVYSTGLRLKVTYNHAPWVPDTLAVGSQSCDDSPISLRTSEVRLSAVPSDPDQDYVNAEFFAWPLDHPEQGYEVSTGRVASGTPVAADLPADFLVDGQTYDWYVRGNDNAQVSDWSPTCRFTVDDTAPATAPTVTSTDYPTHRRARRPGRGRQLHLRCQGRHGHRALHLRRAGPQDIHRA